MKKYELKEKNIFFYKIVFIAIISFSAIFIIYFNVDLNKTEYFYDFESDKVGSFPTGFVGVGRNTDYTSVVEWNENDGHAGKVVYISYLDRIYLDEINYSGIELNTLFNKATEGVVSFDIYFLHGDLGIAIDVCQEDWIWNRTDDISFRILYEEYPDFSVRDSLGRLEGITTPPLDLNSWYHFEIEFNCQQNEWSVEISKNERFVGVGSFNFYVQPSYLSQIYFSTYKLGCEFYIDNVQISLNSLI